jgi:serine/threonine-protein kinase
MLGNRYEVGDLLGRGGMAEVHLGRDTRLGRQVAIKMLRSDLARDPVFQARFRREAQSAAALNHPAVVAVYDTGEDIVTESGGAQARLPYIVMEYVEGITARDLLRSVDGSGVGVPRALNITAGVLSALEYSHRAGIVHRDIKPANVMLTPNGDVKVMDFGIARAVADASATMTQTQAVIGTAQYLSPEQARGETVDARSDLYSAGCLLYELLTGRPPFVGDSPVAVAYQHVREIPQPPSHFNPEVDDALDRVVLKALAKDREERYQDAAAFVRDLQAARAGLPVTAPAVAAAAGATAATQAMPSLDEQTRALSTAASPSGTDTITAARVEDPEENQPRGRRVAGYIGLALAVLAVFALAALLANRFVGGEQAPQQVAVPELINMTSQEAKAALDAVGLDYAEGQPLESADKKPGTVVDQSPEARTQVDPHTTVTVQLSIGPGSVEVPDVSKKTQTEARQILEGADLKVGDVTMEDSADVPQGYVVRTEPKVGKQVEKNSTVALVLSTGKMRLPDVTGTNYQDARKELLGLGFQVTVQREPSENKTDTVISQSPGPGSIDQGSEVTLVVADPMPPPTTTQPEPTNNPTDTATEPAPEPTS